MYKLTNKRSENNKKMFQLNPMIYIIYLFFYILFDFNPLYTSYYFISNAK